MTFSKGYHTMYFTSTVCRRGVLGMYDNVYRDMHSGTDQLGIINIGLGIYPKSAF